MFYEKQGVVRTYMDSSLPETMIVEWDNLFDSAVVKESCEAQLEKAKAGAKYLIIDTSKAQGVPSKETQDWFVNYLFPNFDKVGLKLMVTVLPQSALTKLASKSWIKNATPFSFESYDCGSQNEAKQLIRSKQ